MRIRIPPFSSPNWNSCRACACCVMCVLCACEVSEVGRVVVSSRARGRWTQVISRSTTPLACVSFAALSHHGIIRARPVSILTSLSCSLWVVHILNFTVIYSLYTEPFGKVGRPHRSISLQKKNYKIGWYILALLHIRPFVPVPNCLLSRFWNRDMASGTKASRFLSWVAEPGQNVPDAKIFFAPRGIRSQDFLPTVWFSCQLT